MIRWSVLLAPFTLAACGFDAGGTGADGVVVRSDTAVVVQEEDTAPVTVEDAGEDSGAPPADTYVEPEEVAIVDAPSDSPLPGCTVENNAGHEYLFCQVDANWEQARTSCQVPGYDLVVVNDKTEHDWLVSKVKSMSKNQWHIGLHDRAVEGTFKWVDGSSPGFTSWGSWEPNNFFGEDCVILHKSGIWNDVKCTDGSPREAFICETK